MTSVTTYSGSNSTTLRVLGSVVRMDDQGRFSFSDCWKLSGGRQGDKPSEWYSAAKTQDFLDTLQGERKSPLTPVKVVSTGSNNERGYWGVREAITYYATWISPQFYLAVIRAFDAMHGTDKPTSVIRSPRAKPVDRTFRQFFNIAKTIGLDDNQATLKAGQVAKKLCGIDVLGLMEIESLAAPRDEHTLTPRQIGQELGDISAQRVNQELLKLGFQSFTIDGKGHRVYHLTEAGKPFGRLEDTARAHTEGGVTVLRGYPGIIDILGSQLRPVPQLERGAHQEAAHATM